MTDLSDDLYPDNPDIEVRSGQYGTHRFPWARLTRHADGTFDFTLLNGDPAGDEVALVGIDLRLWLPTIPQHLRQDSYLAYLTVVRRFQIYM